MRLPDGWLPDNEVRELQRLAKGKAVLELGAWKGRSTVALGLVAKYVVSVDRHEGVEGYGVTGMDSLPDYLDAVRGLANVAIVVADFDAFCPFLCDYFDLVFVDGDHDTDAVARDTQTALEHVARGRDGTLVFHDWDMDSVREGVASALGSRSPARVVGSLASFEAT
jgi:SAM-dependent methyltransferase